MNKLIYLLTLFAIFSIAYSADDDSSLPNTVDLKDPTTTSETGSKRDEDSFLPKTADEKDATTVSATSSGKDDDHDDEDNDEDGHGVGPESDEDDVGDFDDDDYDNDDDDLNDIPATISTKSQEFADACLYFHNKYRASVGAGPLKWNDDLAKGSAEWSIKIGNDGKLSHSHGPYGENTACGTTINHNLRELHALWGNEKQWYIPGRNFPDVSTTGDWHKVGHYTQVVWADTTEVGCGVTVNDGWAWLTCRYLGQGNIRGEKPY